MTNLVVVGLVELAIVVAVVWFASGVHATPLSRRWARTVLRWKLLLAIDSGPSPGFARLRSILSASLPPRK